MAAERARSPRQVIAFIASLAVAVGLLLSATSPAWSASSLPRVDIYGDSVTWESEYFMVLALSHRADVHMHVYPGAQICQWFSDMRATAATHPSMVLITEGLWGARDCDHTSDLFREAQDDARTAATIFSQSRVVFSADPVVLNSTQFVQTMGAKNYPRLLAAFRNAASLAKNATFNDAAVSVAPKNVFVWTRPCLSSETATMGCSHGSILVREPDGIHLCPVTPPQPGHCPTYSSGELRWAVAVTQPAVRTFALRP
jgi:hypothetical protein